MSGTSTSVLMEEVKKNIRALLISAPRGLSVDDIEHDYRAMLGKPMPFKQFKCSNCLEFLKTIPDVVSPSWVNGSLILRGIADSSTRHIAKLVSRQKVPRSRSRRMYKPPICTKPLLVPSYFRSNIKELLSVYPKGVLGSALNVAYARHYGEEINYAKLGFRSMSHLLGSIQDIVTIVKDARGGFRVCATAVRGKLSSQAVKQLNVTSKPPPPAATKNVRCNSIPNRNCTTDLGSLESDDVDEKNEKNVEKVKNLLDSKSGVSEDLKENLIAVLAKRPNGVWAARLPFEYKALFNKELSILSLGFYSIIELASSLPDVFRIERPFGNSDWLLFLSEKSRKEKNMTKIHLPENGVGKGGCYCQLTMPDTDTNDVFVTHIKNPGCFWVQLITHYDQLTELENEIREFYKSKRSAEFLMVDCLVKIGQICAARFPVDNLWYRALITATPTPTMVEVFYVDYGNSSQMAKSDLRLLKKEFIQLPAQALKSKLANIKPKSMGKWDPAAAHRLNDLTFNKALYSIVCDTKVKDEVLSLCICDTTSKVDVHVNDVLVEEGFAVLVKQAANDRVSSPVLASLGEPIALNPTNQQFPEYSMPYNLYNDILGSYGVVPMANGPSTEQLLSSAPEESLPRFEEAKPSAEDLEFMRQVCEELSDEGRNSVSGSNTVKRLELHGDKFIHLINYQGKPHVVRSEVSALLWESDLLRSMLRKKNMVVPKEVIAREDHDELFNELKRQKVGDFDDVDDVREFASLYELSTIPSILEAFKHPSAELVQKVKEEKVIFDANPTTYWIETKDEGNNSSETDSCQSEPEEELELEELKLALQALQFRRKRILRAMMKGDLAQGQNTVDEVDEVEKQIVSIHHLITRTEEKDGKSKDTEGTKDNKDTEDTKDKGDIQGEGTMSNKETKGKKENVSSSVQEDSTEVQEEIKTSKNNELPALKDPSPTTKHSATIPNDEIPTERMPHEQDKPIDSQKHFLNLIDKISAEKNPPAFGLPKHDFLRVYPKPEEYPSRSSLQNLNHVTAPRQTTPTLIGLPPFLPPHRVNIVHRPHLPFPPPNANHGLPPQPVRFSSFNPHFYPIAPSFADITFPPVTPPHAQGLVSQQPIPPFFFPWGQNSFGSGAIMGETIHHNRPGW